MKCPKCNTVLAITLTSGVEIDYCPDCRGVWLDRGELEKIIERSAGYEASYNKEKEYRSHHDDDHHDKHTGYGQYGKRKKGFLGDLFDF